MEPWFCQKNPTTSTSQFFFSTNPSETKKKHRNISRCVFSPKRHPQGRFAPKRRASSEKASERAALRSGWTPGWHAQCFARQQQRWEVMEKSHASEPMGSRFFCQLRLSCFYLKNKAKHKTLDDPAVVAVYFTNVFCQFQGAISANCFKKLSRFDSVLNLFWYAKVPSFFNSIQK